MGLIVDTGGMPRVRAYAHRGGAGEATENSLAAFSRAVDLGYTHLETDIRPTRDGVALLHHDAFLGRTTDGHGPVRDTTWEGVRRLTLADGSTPLRLEELFEAFPDVHVNVDVKEDGSIPALVEAVQRCQAWQRVCITSFSPGRLRRVRSLIPAGTPTSAHPWEVAALRLAATGAPLPRVPERPRRIQIPMRAFGLGLATPDVIALAHRHGLAVDVWTIDDEVVMEALIDLGVDGIMTDHPTRLRSVLERRGLWGSGGE